VEKWPRLLETMEQYLNTFLNIVQAAHVSFLDEGTFDTLSMPTQRGNWRQAGVDFNKVRMRQVAAAVVALAAQPTGFTVSDLARKISEIAGPELEIYTSRRAAYDLSKIRGKGLVERIGKSRRYRTTSEGVGKLGAYTILRDYVIKPLMAGVVRRQGRPRPFILSISTVRTCVRNSTRRSKPWGSPSHETLDTQRQHVCQKKSLRGYPLRNADSVGLKLVSRRHCGYNLNRWADFVVRVTQ
jgi:hypothetical protein